MDAHEQHAVVVVEDVLRAVAVVRVVVEDQHPFALICERGRGDSHVRHQAEPHRLRGVRMMTGRAHRTERCVALTPAHRLDRGQSGPCRQGGSSPRAGGGVGVGVETASTRGTDVLDAVEVGPWVHTFEVGACGGDGFQRFERIDRTVTLHAREHRLQALGSLGVARTGEVLQVRSVGTEQHGHIGDATVLGE